MPRTPSGCLATVWLATPDAGDLVHPSRLAGASLDEWSSLRTERRRRDWRSSRALLDAAAVPPGHASSLSHSHGYAALAVTPGDVAPGVDVEWLAPRNFGGMSSVAYSVAETDYLASLDDPSLLAARFYEFWTLKEGFAKALHLPLVDALRQCRFVDCSGRLAPVIPTTRPWRATVFAPRPQLRLTVVCVAGSPGRLAGDLRTDEFPGTGAVAWPVVMDLASEDGPRASAW